MLYERILAMTSRWSADSTRNPSLPTPPLDLQNNVRTSNRSLASTLATEEVLARTYAAHESCRPDHSLSRRHSDYLRILTQTAAAATIQNHDLHSRRRLAGTNQRGLRSSRSVLPGRQEYFYYPKQLLRRKKKVGGG